MTLGRAALVLFLGGLGLFAIGLFGVIGEAGVELHRQTTLGSVMQGIMLLGMFSVPVGVVLGIVRAIRGPGQRGPEEL